MKKTDEIFKREYEERFNWYILKVISKTYKNYLRNKQNKYAKEVYEINMDLLVGDNDVIFEENIVPQRLEEIVCDFNMYRAIKPLTFTEKVVVFLFFILEKNTREIADIMGYKDRSSVYRVCNRAIKKIKENFYELDGDFDD